MHRLTIIFLVVALFGVTAVSVWAGDDSLEQTQAALNDPSARTQIIQNDPKAQSADQQVKNLGLSQAGQDQAYRVSGSITQNLAEQTGGDSEKMAAKVQGYLRDPASLEKDLTPEQKSQIHDLSQQVPTAQ